ncbi:PepSY-associated TM helix domain-containing protein [Arcicella sp. LKC2W]|uniref:PepSY-associated TM helix domain-containing protein n=1 Tax=Arcicella sp. LKC2W TaxID=2984198 RepID=UPI002B2192ED|nr:PepSY-associated TM helix domain-containing protein [Arcicella sp. LKC2W]MEA5461520.1 PepSY-associated TM helix domain-containing protein [Arcicella sp. LKC2W]
MKNIKKIIGQIHLWLGLASGLIVFVVSITGALYAFQEEFDDFTKSEFLYVNDLGNHARLPPSVLLASFKKAYPKEKVSQVRIKKVPSNSAVLIITQKRKGIAMNPFTGKIHGEKRMDRDFMMIVVQLHINLLLGEVGEEIIKWNTLVFFVMLLSGFYLWFPSKKNQLKSAFKMKWNATQKRINYDLHNVWGFYFLWILLPITFTGLFWVFESIPETIYKLNSVPMTYKKKVNSVYAPDNQKVSLDSLFDVATSYGAYISANIQLPKDSVGTYRFVMRYPYQWVRKQNTLVFDQYKGTLLSQDLYKNYALADKIRMSNFDLHTGRMFGFGGKILALLAGLFGASLPITGFYIWWGKRKKATKKVMKTTTLVGQVSTMTN